MPDSPEPPPEQRRSPRAPYHLIVRYRPPGARGAAWLASPLRDLSSGGARFLSEHPFAAGDAFDIQLLLPAAPQPVWVMARVAWTKPAVMGMREVGVTFDAGDASIQRLIDDAVARKLPDEEAA
ncbi:MAG: PilZ domain-containing protein [Candidatus Omnitrophica bacterium]|nr:PilZ domain-containing protein [Candidatus Omnitrophota bacterium]